MEPDHSGSFGGLREIAPEAVFIGTGRAKDLLRAFYGITDRVMVAADGETLSLGRRAFKNTYLMLGHVTEVLTETGIF